MAIHDIYSKRDQIGKEPEIYQYDELSKKLRTQIHHIIKETIGFDKQYNSKAKKLYEVIHRILKKEYGVFFLYSDKSSPEYDVLQFFMETRDVNKALDVVELCFKGINTYIKEDTLYSDSVYIKMKPVDAIEELNQRFKENAVGYVFESNRIIRIDSTVTHSEITKPTLKLLSNNLFQNANEEYLKAHEHYRHGRNKECLTDCLKAFESVMKIIIKAKGWGYDERDTASKLIQICLDNELVPKYLQNQIIGLKTTLESGIPTIRNKVGGHGQGDQKKDANDELVRYALNLTGSNIIFLVECSGLR